jgi:hypothetical protein
MHIAFDPQQTPWQQLPAAQAASTTQVAPGPPHMPLWQVTAFSSCSLIQQHSASVEQLRPGL